MKSGDKFFFWIDEKNFTSRFFPIWNNWQKNRHGQFEKEDNDCLTLCSKFWKQNRSILMSKEFRLNLDWRNRYKPVKQFIISWLKDRERRMIDWFQNESRKKILDIILLLCLSIIIQKIDRFEKAKRFKDLILIFFIKQKKEENKFKFKAKQSTHSIDFFRFVVPVVVSLVGWLKKN